MRNTPPPVKGRKMGEVGRADPYDAAPAPTVRAYSYKRNDSIYVLFSFGASATTDSSCISFAILAKWGCFLVSCDGRLYSMVESNGLFCQQRYVSGWGERDGRSENQKNQCLNILAFARSRSRSL